MRADEAQIKRDKEVEENRQADRAAAKENSREELIAVLEQTKLAEKKAKVTQLRTNLVLTALLD